MDLWKRKVLSKLGYLLHWLSLINARYVIRRVGAICVFDMCVKMNLRTDRFSLFSMKLRTKFTILFVCSVVFALRAEVTDEERRDRAACDVQSVDGGCEEASADEDASIKYNRASNNNRWSHYLKLFEEANRGYEACILTTCSCYQSVLKTDLSPWIQNGLNEEMVKAMRDKGTFYQIIDHKLYRDEECMFPFRCKGVEHFLLQILPNLPDMEFVLNTRDWPQVPKQFGPYPVFSFSKTKEYYDIMYPAWTFWEGGPAIALYPTGLGRWDLHVNRIKSKSAKWPWHMKQSKAFFRGSRTSAERDPLVLLSRQQPELADAEYTKNQAWKSDADTLGWPPATEVHLEDHCRYKYLFNYRGVAASFRFKHLFLCRSLVIHVGSEWLEFFYPALKPWVHYVPLQSGAQQEQIRDLLEFLQEHDHLAERIAERGFRFINQHLRMNDVTCYWRRLLRAFAKLLRYQPTLDPTLKRIP